MDDIELIDTHTHVVSGDLERYPLEPRVLSPNPWYLEAPASAEDLLEAMDESGVERAVLVQGVGAYTYDNRYAIDSAAAHPSRFVSACCIDVEAEDALDRLDAASGPGRAQGIRLFALSREGSSWLAQEKIFPIWNRAHERGLHVIVTILPQQMDELRRVLERFPEIPISLDHCGFALGEPDSRKALYALACHPQLHLKVTTHIFDECRTAGISTRVRIRELVDTFGADRLMWGSDYCQIHDRSYAELVREGRDAFADLSTEERSWCLRGTAQKLWPGLTP